MDEKKTQGERERKRLGKENLYRLLFWGAAELFAVFSLIRFSIADEGKKILTCGFTTLLLCVPYLASKLLRFRMNGAFYAFCILYALGPMLGHSYQLYYEVSWWDDLLHGAGGVVFAVFGVYIVKRINKNNRTNVWTCAVFALCFSIAISAVWEFVEYGCDKILSTDMQNDTVITSIDSYLLGAAKGETGSIHGIGEVYIDGVPLGVGGYIDVGLVDTMSDMLIEALGATVFVAVYLIDKERHPLLTSTKAPDEA